MSKYDFNLHLDTENSLSIIISMLKPNTKVLEFGCANGRLTKYLKEEMLCTVDIVEIDEEAGTEASRYSNKSLLGQILGDIESFQWLEQLKDDKYDYIIFADVLEHLHNPMNVLKTCKNILKDDGSIVMSVPNIAHNSIIIDLINDEFKYNEIGLLDNTHLTFFGYKSLLRMIETCGYKTVLERATYSKVGENEIKNTYASVNREISKQLRERQNGNLYQFVFEIKMKEYAISQAQLQTVNLNKNQEYEFVCYIRENECDEYNELKSIKRKINPKQNCIKVPLIGFKDLYELRIDPLDCNCTIDIKKVYTIIDNEKVDINIKQTNGINLCDSIYIFNTEDPQIYIDVEGKNVKELYFEFIYIDYDSENINIYTDIFTKAIIEKENIIKRKEKKIHEKEKKIENQQAYISEIQNSRSWVYLNKIKKVFKRA